MFNSILNLVALKRKARYDYVSDQYTRLFMPKLFVVASSIMTWNYFHDQITCAISDSIDVSHSFIQSTCWINGFFIYQEMHGKNDYSAFYGIPADIDKDGLTIEGDLCSMKDRAGKPDPRCVQVMTKRYFLQYQWLPFYVCSLSIFYYLPYIFYKMVNKDLISLVDSVREHQTAEKIAKNYFNYRVNSKVKINIIVTMNFLVKICYIITNVMGIVLTSTVLEGRFYDFGYQWLMWRLLPNHIAHDIHQRDSPKPSNYLLPPVGMCEIHAAVRDARSTMVNKHKFICEVSQNVMYQHILVILWFFITCGIFTSCASFTLLVVEYTKAVFWMFKPSSCRETMHGKIHSLLTHREIEYLEVIKNSNLALYGEVLRELTKLRPDLFALSKYFNNECSYMARHV